MAGRKPEKIRPSAFANVPAVDDVGTQRAFDVVTDAVQALQAQRQRSHVVFDLVVGVNRVSTGLGRKAEGCNLTPTVADAMFSWSFDAVDDKIAIISVIGAAQPSCRLEFY